MPRMRMKETASLPAAPKSPFPAPEHYETEALLKLGRIRP